MPCSFQLDMDEQTDPEDRPTLENIIPLKNIWHGWNIMAGLVTVCALAIVKYLFCSSCNFAVCVIQDTVGQVCHNPAVESAWQMTCDTTSKFAEEFAPAVDTVNDIILFYALT